MKQPRKTPSIRRLLSRRSSKFVTGQRVPIAVVAFSVAWLITGCPTPTAPPPVDQEPPSPPTYSVNYDANGGDEGSVPVDSTTYEGGDTATVLDNTGGLSRDGFAFAGWNTSADGSESMLTVGDTIVVAAESITLFAIWVKDFILLSESAAEDNQWSATVYGDGQFISVARSGTNRVMTSANGETWTARSAAEQNTWESVAYGAGLYVAVSSDGTNRVMTSPDGISWTARSAAEQNFWESVSFGNGLFVAVSSDGTNRIMTSANGTSWSPVAAPAPNSWFSVTYGGGLFVAVASDGTDRVMTSPDGANWTSRSAISPDSQWYDVTYGGGQFVAVGPFGTNLVMTSPDGQAWTGRSGTFGNLVSIAYGNGLFVATELPSSTIRTSEDGITWTSETAPSGQFWDYVAFGGNRFVFVGQSSGAMRATWLP